MIGSLLRTVITVLWPCRKFDHSLVEHSSRTYKSLFFIERLRYSAVSRNAENKSDLDLLRPYRSCITTTSVSHSYENYSNILIIVSCVAALAP